MEAREKSQKKAVERSQQKERENTNTSGDNVTSSTKVEIENIKKDTSTKHPKLLPLNND